VKEGDGVEGFALFVLVVWELGEDELVGISEANLRSGTS
jgi:hypothetical protein